MKTVTFIAGCIAVYKGSLDLPDEVNPDDKKQVVKYILEHLGEVPCEDLSYIEDTEEPVTEDDILYIS